MPQYSERELHELATAILEVLESGDADIYYDTELDPEGEVSEASEGVRRHQTNLVWLRWVSGTLRSNHLSPQGSHA